MIPRIVGISITDTSVHALELSKTGVVSTLHAIDEWENPFGTGPGDADPQALELFTEYLAAFIKTNQVKATDASVAVDSSSLFIHRLPVEESASDGTIREQIRWEIEQYFPGIPASEFITDYHRMSRFPSVRLNEVLSVTVRRKTAQGLEKALSDVGLRLHILDADQFSAETTFRQNYPDALRRHVALVGIKSHRIDTTILKNGNMESYSYAPVQTPDEISERIAAVSRENTGIPSLVVYGPALNAELLTQIRRGVSVLVEALNPLRNVTIANTLRVGAHLSTPSYRFAAVLGVALRRD
jgi:Tfp pilus assembly PilM family ATPase